MAKKRKNPLYRKNGRYYADFRGYKDVGGSQEAMIPEGERYATKTYRVAKSLAKARLAELKRLRRTGLDGDLRYLGPFVDYHLNKEAENGRSVRDLSQVEQRLEAAVTFFGGDTLLRHIDTLWLQEYVSDVKARARWQGTARETDEPIAAETQVKYLNGGIAWAAVERPYPGPEGRVSRGFLRVRAGSERPKGADVMACRGGTGTPYLVRNATKRRGSRRVRSGSEWCAIST